MAGVSKTMILLFLLCGVALQTASAEKTLAHYKKVLGSATAKIEDEHRASRQKILGQYAKSLESVYSTAKQKGDLEAVIALKKEKERFSGEKTIPAEPVPDASPIMLKMQAHYHRMMMEADHTRDRKTVDLLGNYARHLDGMKKRYVRDGKIDKAIEIRAEVDTVTATLEEKKAATKVYLDVKKDMAKAAAPARPVHSRRLKTEIKVVPGKSMKLYPKGQRFGHFPVQETDDPTACFDNAPVYFNQKTGRDVVYEIKHKKMVKSMRWKGAAMKDLTLEIFDMDGKLLVKGGPYQGGNQWGEFTITFKPSRDFVLKISNHVSTWLFINEIEFE